MLRSIPTLLLTLCAALTAANPAGPLPALTLDKRQGTATLGNITCGKHSYTKQQVDDAVAEGCRLHKAGQQLGSSKYPHRFNNYEGLVLATKGPYQEFPILQNGLYTGSKRTIQPWNQPLLYYRIINNTPPQEAPAQTASSLTPTTKAAAASTSAP